MSELSENSRLAWLTGEDIRPYVYVRKENRVSNPGRDLAIDWFPMEPIFKDPLRMDEVGFTDQILTLESRAFASTNLAMPRWVFYDCAVVPGLVAGFAIRQSKASRELREILQPARQAEWLPISLFIVIPAVARGEWVAHNLCSVNSLLPSDQSIYGLGFLTKAFGLWYANVQYLCGFTQWARPAMRLHTHYGDFEVLTAYTPSHSYARTVTYRMVTDPKEWKRFFSRERAPDFDSKYEYAGFMVNPVDDESLKSFQRRLEAGESRYFLNAAEIRTQALDSALHVYKRRLIER